MTMSDPRGPDLPDPAASLDALRVEIDRIDTAMHGLLMERGEIVDRLIAVKARQGGGSAFRPGREADMMRRLVRRHAGILPLDTVEGIWRIIISTFTYVQAPYTVHADISGGDPMMRDSCRFHFGFTVPLTTHDGAAAVIAAVANAAGDLGLLRVDDATPGWWEDLTDPDAPKIIARLPFVERADHAAGLPLYVVAKPLAAAAVTDIRLYAVAGAVTRPADPTIEIVAGAAGGAMLVAAGTLAPETVAARLATPGAATPTLKLVGSHARRFEIDADLSLAAQ